MGQTFSEPVDIKETERDHNETFNVAVSSCQGWRVSQEDNHSLILNMPGPHKAAFFAVYDGHGSARVSKHASENLWRLILENEKYSKGNFKEALEESFLDFDRKVNQSYNAQLAGTTAVCFLIVNNTIYCANIGDSRAVACVNCECVPLSYDHKPENPLELKRILAAGGYVLGNRVNGNLALSRAFGDFHYKGNEQLPAEQQIVSPFPDVKTIDLNDDLDFLVLACDGIWDVLSSEEVVEFVISRLEQSMEPGLICEQLTTRCLATDYELVIGCDNMTVLLICYTRGRSWVDYCTDIFNKHTQRLGGMPRTRPTSFDETADATNATTAELLNKTSGEHEGLVSNLEALKLIKEHYEVAKNPIFHQGVIQPADTATTLSDTEVLSKTSKTQDEESKQEESKDESSKQNPSDPTCEASDLLVSTSSHHESDAKESIITKDDNEPTSTTIQETIHTLYTYMKDEEDKERCENKEDREDKEDGEQEVGEERPNSEVDEEDLLGPARSVRLEHQDLLDNLQEEPSVETGECKSDKEDDQSEKQQTEETSEVCEVEDEQQPDATSTTSEVEVES